MRNSAEIINNPPSVNRGGPTALVIFGATGDLSRKRIFPALYKLYSQNLLPQTFVIVASARSQHTSIPFRSIVFQMIQEKQKLKKDVWQKFAQEIHYFPSDLALDIRLQTIATAIDEFEKKSNTCLNRIFYLAISPQIVQKAIENLGKYNFHLGCTIHKGAKKPRIIIEKPFGQDLKSAQNLAQTLSRFFAEDQIYRIDHYLGKETVQNIFAFRFGNELFEPVWNNQYIDHVQITTAEDISVEKRGEYYDQTGALRDIVQNHLLQLLALTTMEEPEEFTAESIRRKKLQVIRQIKKLTKEEIVTSTVRAQYQDYRQEEKIDPNSVTESYALVRLFIENPRWLRVPFYLRTGKKLMGKVTSIILQFKEKSHELFKTFWQKPLPNHITLQIQPNEGIGIRLVAKKPGLTTKLEPVDMEFCYKTSFDIPQPDAYERLLMDVVIGDQSLFLSQSVIEESWKIIDPIREVWDHDQPKLATYKPGSWGPKEADDLIAKDGRQWLQPLLTICKI
ncbi:glucose-6-phosphate dehydrogenase [Candidatus Curtissbacteria bacterium]|nr:glucose-6-phosphate dehydrogenase [Candidatus Curtissbacteria bacterium]